MKESADRVARFVDDLLHGRRPHRFEATREEAEAMTAAAGLVAARVGADVPDRAALDRIHQRLAEALDESPTVDRRLSRRAWLRTAGAAAAAVMVGVGLDELVTNRQESGGAGGAATLLPDNGSWRPVAAVTDVPSGHAMTVSTASLDAVIINDGGTITAVSGVCTHLGCKLQPNDSDRKLDCPCHQTAFSWSGKVLYYRLKAAPASLPEIPSRVNNGQIELYTV
jgi:nitrite reductase/ring-hydroxylating ferredoxin subunit